MCIHDLPDMNALNSLTMSIHIRQIPRACVTIITYFTFTGTCSYGLYNNVLILLGVIEDHNIVRLRI